jgi:DNA-binding NtrC family response regulator
MQIGVDSSRAVDNKRIYVVDEDEITRAAIQFMLHDENEAHEVATLADAYEKSKSAVPDVIVLGLPMVAAAGIGMVGEVLATVPAAKLVLVADTADAKFAQDCIRAGAHAVVLKPLTIEEVRNKVDFVLGRAVF